MKQKTWRLSGQAWLGLLALALVFWITISYASLVIEIILILFGSFLFSLAIDPLATVMARRRVPRGVTVIGVYIVLLGLAASLGALLVPIVGAETAMLRANGPNLLQTALSRLATTPLVGQLIPSNSALSQNLLQYLYALGPTFLNTVANVGETVLNLLVVLILTYFLATDETIVPRLLRSLVPKRSQAQVALVVTHLRKRLARWIWAQLAIALYFALVFGLGLTLLNVPFALTIALVGGTLEIIPYVGGTVAVTLGVLSALTVNPWLAVWVIALWAIVVEVQGHIVAPTFYGRAIHIHPAIVLVALLIGAKTKGIVGVFFAVPVAVVLITLLQEVQATSQTIPTEASAQSSDPDEPVLQEEQTSSNSRPSADKVIINHT